VSPKFVLYKRTGGKRHGEYGKPTYIIKSQLEFGGILNREHERADEFEREVLAESDDLDLLKQMRRLAKGVDDE
jgi:hypothetical protein